MTPDETARRLRDARLAQLRDLVGRWESGALRGRRGLGKLAESLAESIPESILESPASASDGSSDLSDCGGSSSRSSFSLPESSGGSAAARPGFLGASETTSETASETVASRAAATCPASPPVFASPVLPTLASPAVPPAVPAIGAGLEPAESADSWSVSSRVLGGGSGDASSGGASGDTSSGLSGDSLVSTGSGALDRLLARGGLERGSLVEWFSEGRGGGAGTLAWLAAREASRRGGGVVVFDRRGRFYPPAAAAWGVDPRSLAVVRAATDEDERWAAEQALRSPATAAVWIWRDELSTRDFRRWQLAAEASGALGLLLRPARVRGRPTWAEVQWSVRPAGRLDADQARDRPRDARLRSASSGTSFDGSRRRVWRLEVELVRCRGGRAGTTLELELDDVTGEFRQATRHETTRHEATRHETTAYEATR